MKTKNILVTLLLILTALISTHCSAQNYRQNFGPGYIRYTSDSNYFVIGKSSGIPPKIKREFNSPLFDFNSNQFFWSNISGLNISPSAIDSSAYRKLTIYKDTGDGEFSPYKVRQYVFQKPNYANRYDLYDLICQYRAYTSGNLTESKQINIFNNCYQIFDDQDLNYPVIDGNYTYYFNLSDYKSGQYLILINYEYRFDENKSDGKESIDVVLLNTSMFTERAHNTHIYYRPNGLISGQTNSGSITCIINATNTSEMANQIVITGISDNGNKITITKLRITAVLIN